MNSKPDQPNPNPKKPNLSDLEGQTPGMKDQLKSDIDWTAFCYLAGELTDQDEQAFETKLSHDETAQQALVSAVELVQKTRTALSDSEHSQSEKSTTTPIPTVGTSDPLTSQPLVHKPLPIPTWGIISGIGATLLIVGLIGWQFWPSDPPATVAKHGNAESNDRVELEEDVAEAWVTSIQNADEFAEDGLALYENLSVETEAEADWMLSALLEKDQEPSNSMIP